MLLAQLCSRAANATKPVMSADQAVAIGIKAVQERYKPAPLTMVFGPDLRITNMTYIKRSELAAHRELTYGNASN
ncbi:MAG: hypothetical protein U0S12_01165 [Fimbriimonadales bacterium]